MLMLEIVHIEQKIIDTLRTHTELVYKDLHYETGYDRTIFHQALSNLMRDKTVVIKVHGDMCSYCLNTPDNLV